MVHVIIAGGGKPMFDDSEERTAPERPAAEASGSGGMVLYYPQPV